MSAKRVVNMLREAAIAGRLTVEELDARCESAYTAVTRGELAALLEDLPVGSRMKPPPAPVNPAPTATSDGWPGASPWLAGDQRFYVQWKGPSNPHAEVTIAMTDCGDHSVTEIYGVAPQAIRAALARLTR